MNYTYTIQCTDELTGKIGCFLFDRAEYMQTGKLHAISEVFPNLIELFAWDNRQYPKQYCFAAYTPSPSDL